MTPLLHLPIDFERREDVRRLKRAIGASHWGTVVAFRLWADWATAQVEFRPLKFMGSLSDFNVQEYPWKDDDLTYIIEDFCEMTVSEPGELIQKAIAAGMILIKFRGGVFGLVLNDFWRHNSHLSPSHKTIQQRGAEAMHLRRKLAEVDELANTQARLIEAQGHLVFQQKEVTPEETRQAIAVVMRLDRACGLPQRKTSDYTEQTALMADALRVVREFKTEEINQVCEYVYANRDNPRMVKLPERLLERFGELLGKAQS
jgi:hypothetical protein